MLKVWMKTGCRPTWAPFLWVTLDLLQRKTHFWSLAPSSGLDSPARTPPPHTRMCKSTRLDTSKPEAFFSGLILYLTSKAGPHSESLFFCALACACVCFKLLPDLEPTRTHNTLSRNCLVVHPVPPAAALQSNCCYVQAEIQ